MSACARDVVAACVRYVSRTPRPACVAAAARTQMRRRAEWAAARAHTALLQRSAELAGADAAIATLEDKVQAVLDTAEALRGGAGTESRCLDRRGCLWVLVALMLTLMGLLVVRPAPASRSTDAFVYQ